MKSPEVVQQLKKYQSRRRNQFLVRCRARRHNEKKSYSSGGQDGCSESVGQAPSEKSADATYSRPAAFSISSTLSNTVEPVTNPVTINASATETAHSFGSEIWSKSDSAFTSFTNISNSQNNAV